MHLGLENRNGRNSPPVSRLYFEEQTTELGWWVKHNRSAPCFL